MPSVVHGHKLHNRRHPFLKVVVVVAILRGCAPTKQELASSRTCMGSLIDMSKVSSTMNLEVKEWRRERQCCQGHQHSSQSQHFRVKALTCPNTVYLAAKQLQTSIGLVRRLFGGALTATHSLLPSAALPGTSAKMPAAFTSRAVLRQSRFLLRRNNLRQASTTSEAASKVKETASATTSKASEGLSRVTSSAGSIVGGAASGARNALNKVGGRTGRLIAFVDSQYICRCWKSFLLAGSKLTSFQP